MVVKDRLWEGHKMKQEPEIRSIWKLIILHLLPGAAASLIYYLLLKAGFMGQYPKQVILVIAGLVTIVPLQLGYLCYVAKKETGTFRIFAILGLQNKLQVKTYIVYTLVLLTAAGLLMKALQHVSDYLLSTVLRWIPADYIYKQDMSVFSRNIIIVSIIASFFFFTLIGPITEELYFRGFLLARMKWMGHYGVIVNLVLFAIYHFWSPWLIAARIVALFPLFYFVYKKGSMKLGIFVHCLANFTEVVALIMLV